MIFAKVIIQQKLCNLQIFWVLLLLFGPISFPFKTCRSIISFLSLKGIQWQKFWWRYIFLWYSPFEIDDKMMMFFSYLFIFTKHNMMLCWESERRKKTLKKSSSPFSRKEIYDFFFIFNFWRLLVLCFHNSITFLLFCIN